MKDIIKNIEKATNFITDKGSIHSYIENFYDKEFLKFKNSPITLVELGVNHGGSIRLWNEYFKNVIIYGMDISETNTDFVSYVENNKNINYIIGDAYSHEISKIIPEFNIFIDDGPHTIDSQILSIKIYLNKLLPFGVFVIEDIQNIENANILKKFIDDNYENFESKILDLREYKNRYDDIMLIVKHKNV